MTAKCRADWLEGVGGGGGELGKGGEETDGKAGLVPTIPRHDYTGKPSSTLSHLLICVCSVRGSREDTRSSVSLSLYGLNGVSELHLCYHGDNNDNAWM